MHEGRGGALSRRGRMGGLECRVVRCSISMSTCRRRRGRVETYIAEGCGRHLLQKPGKSWRRSSWETGRTLHPCPCSVSPAPLQQQPSSPCSISRRVELQRPAELSMDTNRYQVGVPVHGQPSVLCFGREEEADRRVKGDDGWRRKARPRPRELTGSNGENASCPFESR